jgi:hypothetical protein
MQNSVMLRRQRMWFVSSFRYRSEKIDFYA